MHDLGCEKYVLKRKHRHASMYHIVMYLPRVICGYSYINLISIVALIYGDTSKSMYLAQQDIHKPMWKKCV